MYTVKSGEQYAKITITDSETVKFSDKWDVFGVKGDDITVKLNSTDTGDGVYNTDDTGGAVVIAHGRRLDTMYLTGTGDVIVWAGASAVDCPFKSGAKGGGSGGDNTHYKGTTTTAIENGSTTNPITIDGEEYTAVFGDIAVYNYTEFVFDGSVWSEFGRPFDTTPTSGSANAVTSDGIKTALDTKQNTMQYTTTPTITASMLGEIVQYVGVSDSNYKQGWNYVAVSDGAAEPTYSWHALMDTTPTSGSNNPVTSNGIYNRTPMRRGTGLNSALGYDSNSSASGSYSFSFGRYALAQKAYSVAIGNLITSNSEGLFAIGNCNSSKNGDLFEIGNGSSGGNRSNILEVNYNRLNVNGDIKRDGVGIDDYTTTERKIGKWIDGSDLYQRTFEVTGLLNDNQWHTNPLGTSGIDIVDFSGYVDFNSDGSFADRQPLNMWIASYNYMNMDSIKSDLEYRINRPDLTVEQAVITIKYTKPSAANLTQVSAPIEEVSEIPTVEEDMR